MPDSGNPIIGLSDATSLPGYGKHLKIEERQPNIAVSQSKPREPKETRRGIAIPWRYISP